MTMSKLTFGTFKTLENTSENSVELSPSPGKAMLGRVRSAQGTGNKMATRHERRGPFPGSPGIITRSPKDAWSTASWEEHRETNEGH